MTQPTANRTPPTSIVTQSGVSPPTQTQPKPTLPLTTQITKVVLPRPERTESQSTITGIDLPAFVAPTDAVSNFWAASFRMDIFPFFNP